MIPSPRVYKFDQSEVAVNAMKNRISVDPQVHFGKPCVAGTRITVQNVLELVRDGFSFAEIIRDYYPDLEAEDIQACIQYAMDTVAIEDLHIAEARP